MKNRTLIWIFAVLILVSGIFVFFNFNENINGGQETGFSGGESDKIWMETELKDVRTGENFRISDFDKPIFLESFAVWCPTCTKQQSEIKKLHDELGDSFVSVSLDTDPNEDEAKILEHIQRNGFGWYYAISPPDLTRALIDDFGQGIVNAPSAPVILICSDKSSNFLASGVKKASELKSFIQERCRG